MNTIASNKPGYNECAGILNDLQITGAVKVKCNDGAVTVNIDNCFTYEGKFGSAVCNHIIKRGAKDIAEKILILGVHMNMYSSNFGGFTITAE